MNLILLRKISRAGRPLALLVLWGSLGCGVAMAQGKDAKAQRRQAVALSAVQKAEESFVEGLKQQTLGNTEKAIYYLDKAREQAPSQAGIYFALAQVQSETGHTLEAQLNAARASELDPKNPWYAKLEGELYARANQYEEAIKVYQRAIKAMPAEQDLYLSMAQAQLGKGREEDALKTLDRYAKVAGPSLELLQRRQQILLKANKLSEAVAEAQAYAKANPEDPDGLITLVSLLASNNRSAEATKLLDEHTALLEPLPEYALLRFQLAEQKGVGKKGRTPADGNSKGGEWLLKAFGSSDMALEEKLNYMRQFVQPGASAEDSLMANQLMAKLISAHPDDARAYIVEGDVWAARRNLTLARRAYRRATAMDANKYTLWEQIARMDLELADNDSLLAHTAEALESFPSSAVLWFYNGVAHAQDKANIRAIASLERARKFNVGQPNMQRDILSYLGDLYQGEKDYAKADKAFGDALKQDSLNDHVLNNWAYYLSLRRDQLPLALRLSTKLVTIKANDPTYLDTHGWVLYQTGDFKQAARYLKQATALARGNQVSATLFEHLGDALAKTGDATGAQEAWRKAKTLGGEVSAQIDQKIALGKVIEP